jgi:hypothetical protein
MSKIATKIVNYLGDRNGKWYSAPDISREINADKSNVVKVMEYLDYVGKICIKRIGRYIYYCCGCVDGD